MKYGIREICEVVLRAKGTQKVGNKTFFKNEPVIMFDTLKTSSLEGAATTVYATGGRGNARLVAWEGERTVTFTMEDALISPEGFMILSGAGLTEATKNDANVIYQHVIETTDDFAVTTKGEEGSETTEYAVYVKENPFLPTDMKDNFAYVMIYKDGEIASEPLIPEHDQTATNGVYTYTRTPEPSGAYQGKYKMVINPHTCYVKPKDKDGNDKQYTPTDVAEIFKNADTMVIDYYVARTEGAKQIDITPDKFGGNYYLEASTLFRDTNGIDHPAEFIIPNCKIQSNFTFSLASSGDPSTFTFTLDAFPDFTRFNKGTKVLAALQVFETEQSIGQHREATYTSAPHRDDE
jgi:hypothetical protein